MDKVAGRLTVFFEEPFWVGVFERITDRKLSVCKVTFGAEPKDCEIYDFVLKNYYRLRFSPAVAADVKKRAAIPSGFSGKCRNRYRMWGLAQNHSRL